MILLVKKLSYNRGIVKTDFGKPCTIKYRCTIYYDLIDYTIGTYRDVVQTKLLTVNEYAFSTNEPLSEVKKGCV